MLLGFSPAVQFIPLPLPFFLEGIYHRIDDQVFWVQLGSFIKDLALLLLIQNRIVFEGFPFLCSLFAQSYYTLQKHLLCKVLLPEGKGLLESQGQVHKYQHVPVN